MQNKKPFEMILHVGRVTSLQSWVAKKSCHGQTLTNECYIFDYPSKKTAIAEIQLTNLASLRSLASKNGFVKQIWPLPDCTAPRSDF